MLLFKYNTHIPRGKSLPIFLYEILKIQKIPEIPGIITGILRDSEDSSRILKENHYISVIIITIFRIQMGIPGLLYEIVYSDLPLAMAHQSR